MILGKKVEYMKTKLQIIVEGFDLVSPDIDPKYSHFPPRNSSILTVMKLIGETVLHQVNKLDS